MYIACLFNLTPYSNGGEGGEVAGLGWHKEERELHIWLLPFELFSKGLVEGCISEQFYTCDHDTLLQSMYMKLDFVNKFLCLLCLKQRVYSHYTWCQLFPSGKLHPALLTTKSRITPLKVTGQTNMFVLYVKLTAVDVTVLCQNASNLVQCLVSWHVPLALVVKKVWYHWLNLKTPFTDATTNTWND